MTGQAQVLAQAFGQLESRPRPPRGELTPHILDGHTLPCRLAIDDAGLRHLLIGVPASPTIRPDRASDGVQYEHRALLEGPVTKHFLDLVCRKPHLNDLFCLLAAEVVAAIDIDAHRPERTASRVINRWRELLARPASGPLEPAVLIGLFGELTCLKMLVARAPAAVALWTGPLGAGHDFCAQDLHLEVKATAGRRGWIFEMHGLDQLEAPPGGELYLGVFQVEESPAGRSVPELVDALVQLGADVVTLREKVARAGIGPDRWEAAAEIKYREVQHRFYLVSAGFPRLVAGDLVGGKVPHGITHVHYGLDLNAWPGAPLTAAETEALFDRLAVG